ncbi:MAG TPA: heavy metal translocating P-type ATPase [Petrotogaceae bacterium]|nr:heavy metal translocating P-type ATPase [Petrotogaceae bacterium]
MKKIKKEVTLQGLDCANCARKIEERVNKIDGVDKATLNFMTKTLSIEISGQENMAAIMLKTNSIVKKLEPDVEIVENISQKQEEELNKLSKKELYAFTAGVAVFLCALAFRANHYMSVLLYACAYIIIGWDVIIKAYKGISAKNIFNENFLMTVASLGAFAIKEYPEAVAVMIFYKIGEFFQNMAVKNTKNSIKALLDLKPEYVNVIRDGKTVQVSPQTISTGDEFVVKPGEKIPLDGVIVHGSSYADTSAITGEYMPVDIVRGDEVLSGYVNQSSLITVKASRPFTESTVSKIIEMVQNSAEKKSKTEQFITKFARYYTPAVLIAALLTAVIPPVFLGQPFSEWLYRALIFLVVSCPCALVLSVPLAYFAGAGVASKKGILLKGTNYLEGLNAIDSVLFDKTGTLTSGELEITSIIPAEGYTPQSLLFYAAVCEVHSSHPVAVSVIKKYTKDYGTIDEKKIEKYEEVMGKGIKATYEGVELICGRYEYLKESISVSETNLTGATDGRSCIYIAVAGNYAGKITFSDSVKPQTFQTIKFFADQKIETYILTGDKTESALEVASQLGIKKENVFSKLLPGQKLEVLDKMLQRKKKNHSVVFVGDGINDSPVMAKADISLSMGKAGSQAAVQASDIVIMNDNPASIINAIKIARITQKTAVVNIIFSIAVKASVIVLSTFGLTNMWHAIFADVGVALIAVLNSSRILFKKI